jgi:hypothetical protein
MRLQSTLLVTLLLATFTLPALAAAKDKTKGLPPATATQTVDDKPVTDAKSKLALAQGKVDHAQDALTTLLAQLRKDAEASPAVADAVSALKQAQLDYDSATGPILATVRSSNEYSSAIDAKKGAAKRVLELQADVPPNQDEITKAAVIVLNKGHAITQLETAALAADPKIVVLKEKLASANGRLLKARYDSDQSLKNNPQLLAARKDLETVQADVGPLQSAYNSAQAKYDADVAQANANNPNSNPNNKSTNGKGMYNKKK